VRTVQGSAVVRRRRKTMNDINRRNNKHGEEPVTCAAAL